MVNTIKKRKILLFNGERGKKIENPLKTQNLEILNSKYNDIIIKAAALPFHMIKYSPDLIITDLPSLGFLILPLTKLLRIPYILRLRGDHWEESEDRINCKNPIKKIIEIMRFHAGVFAIKKATVIVPVSIYLRNVILNKLIVEDKKIFAIPPPVDFEKLIKKDIPEKNNLIISIVSNFSFRKKVEGITKILLVIDSILSQFKNIRFFIAGKGKYTRIVLEEIEKLENKDKIFLKYYYNISDLLNMTDIFLYYSFLDAFPMSVQEAKYFGLPVIVNNTCGMNEQIINGVSGYVIDSADLKKLKHALETLIKDKDLRLRMGENGKRDIEKNDYKTIGRKFFNIICKTLE